MSATTPARPLLLSAIAVANILIGALGSLVLGFNLVNTAGTLFALSVNGEMSIDWFDVLILVAIGGPLLITLTMLRWGWAVMNDRPTMAYFPGRATRVGRYGMALGLLVLTLTAPIGFLVLAGISASGWTGDSSSNPFWAVVGLAYLAFASIPVGMIVYARRLNLAAESSRNGEDSTR